VTELKLAEQERDTTLQELETRVADRTRDLTEKNKDILDSIIYAKRIQLGLLSPESEVATVFPESFIFVYPRDIVTGDFFWVHERHSRKFIVVADCTGHGVPGALMSIIGNNLLNQIIIEERFENPSIILQQLDMRLKEAVKSDKGEVKDGMDLVLCMIDNGFHEIYYAGAYRPLFISDADGKINELTPDRQSIGGSLKEGIKYFATKRSAIIPKQRIYLTSDGYYSQFGGPDDKKFMKSRFIRTLESIQGNTMAEQHDLLFTAFEEWKGDKDQVDDVLVVGIEL
jgi:serine phosphatase RsbU (regulator of sigma subunit)